MTITNLRIKHLGPTLTPREQKERVPSTSSSISTITESRAAIENILGGRDHRLMMIVGPCSIHDVDAALEYGQKLRACATKYVDRLFVIMRTYFEKPRTTTGWKGLLIEPFRDGRYAVDHGRNLARQLLLGLAEIGLPTATEFLDPNTPQYLDDLISWAALGARTVESQTHREMASGLSMSVGLKNNTDGSIGAAINAMIAARAPQGFVGINEDARECVVETEGNPYAHLILRGGTSSGPNYARGNVEKAVHALRSRGLPENIIVDCSHANAAGDFRNQENVLKEVLGSERHPGVVGVMLESNLIEGRQDAYGPEVLPGQSITDACISWEKTEELLAYAYENATR